MLACLVIFQHSCSYWRLLQLSSTLDCFNFRLIYASPRGCTYVMAQRRNGLKSPTSWSTEVCSSSWVAWRTATRAEQTPMTWLESRARHSSSPKNVVKQCRSARRGKEWLMRQAFHMEQWAAG